MAETKKALKRIRERITANETEDALKVINDLLQKGVEDYNLYLFAGLAYSSSDAQKAAEYYRKAIAIDAENSQAWKGLYKLYTSTGTCDEFLLNDGKFSDSQEKTDEYRKARTLIRVKLGKLQEVTPDELSTAELSKLVLRNFGLKPDSPHVQQLIATASSNLHQWGEFEKDTYLIACKFHCQHSPSDTWFEWIATHSRQYDKADAFITRQLLSVAAVVLQRSGSLSADVQAAVKRQCTLDKDDDLGSKLARLLSDNNTTEAYNVIGGLSDASLVEWPVCGLSFFVLRNFCQFHRIVRIYEDAKIPSEFRPEFESLQYEARFELCETQEDFESLRRLLDSAGALSPSMEALRLRCLIALRQTTLNELEASAKQAKLPEQTLHSLRAAYYFAVEQDLESAREEVRAALGFGEAHVRDTLLSVEILILRKQIQPAIAQLSNAAQANPFNAELFRMLADALLKCSNPDKARQCAERAQLLNPSSERAARLLDGILIEQEVDDDTRMTKLEAFLEHRPHSRWALRTAALLEINRGKLDQAIEKLQKLTRVSTSAESTKETNALWFFLGEAYKQKGNLQSAVRAFKTTLDSQPNNLTARLQLIQLYQGMGKNEDARAEGHAILESGAEVPQSLSSFFEVLHLKSIMLCAVNATTFDRQLEMLKEFFARAPLLLKGDPVCLLFQKTAARAFKLLLSFNESAFAMAVAETGIGNSLEIATRADALLWQIRCMYAIATSQTSSSDAWNDLALAFLDRYRATNEDDLLEKARQTLRNAITLRSTPLKKAGYWCNYGIVCLLKKDLGRAQHCFIRAIQLDRHSDKGWCLLALLYLKVGLYKEALMAMNNAQKINPSLVEAWCAHALHAEVEGSHETMDLFRHSIVLKPIAACVRKYAYYVAECLRQKKTVDEGTMIDFDTIKQLYYTTEPEEGFLLAIAMLAEHFWYLEEAAKYVNEADGNANTQMHNHRITIKANDGANDVDPTHPALTELKKRYRRALAQLFDDIRAYAPANELFSAVESNDSALFRAVYKSKFYPLLVSASVTFKMEITPDIKVVVEDIRPLHKLAQVYPPDMVKLEELTWTANEEEEVLVRHDHLSDRLYDLLMEKKKLVGDAVAGNDAEESARSHEVPAAVDA